MLRSLRTRLALLFVGTLLLATVIAGAASIRLYQSYNRDQTKRELRGQVGGVADYYAGALAARFGNGRRPPIPVTAEKFEQICGCRLYWTRPITRCFRARTATSATPAPIEMESDERRGPDHLPVPPADATTARSSAWPHRWCRR